MSSVRFVAVAVTAALIVAVAGCTSDKPGTPTARPSQTTSGQLTTVPPTAPTGTVTTPSLPAGTVPPVTTSPPKLSKIVLGPDGFGAVKLGMTPAQAQATHLVSKPTTEVGQTCQTGRLLAAPSGGSPSLFFSPTLGLAAIYAYPGITTPAGIKIGSTLAQLQLAYPTWQGLQGNEGPGYVVADGGLASQYRIAVSNGRVIEIAVQFDAQDCYE
ncbi:MAG TPA: hypothetical protein VKB59_13125 [Micromonosporaceae bacterium]|nr:hypothetical protein [Micromonosporaceae bacterium]